MPVATAAAPTPAATATGFSKEFVTKGIEAMAEMREWHAALKNALDRGYPLAEDWLASIALRRNRPSDSLRSLQARLPTRMRFPFLTNEFNNMVI